MHKKKSRSVMQILSEIFSQHPGERIEISSTKKYYQQITSLTQTNIATNFILHIVCTYKNITTIIVHWMENHLQRTSEFSFAPKDAQCSEVHEFFFCCDFKFW